MMQTICYAFIFLFEVLACAMFFENFYSRKVKTVFCVIAYALAFAFQYGMSFVTVRTINLITFIISVFLIALVCYESKLKTCIFTTLMLTVFMFITELIVIHASTFLLEINFTEYETNLLVLVVQASLSKLLFFFVIFFVSKFYKIRDDKQSSNKFTVLLGVLPITSLAILYTITYWGIKTSDVSPFNAVLSACSILLLFANLFVFYVYEAVRKTNLENTQLLLEKQRNEISTEYYELLSKEYENSRIIIHDIKNHFQHIAGLTMEGQQQEVLDYIDSIAKDFGLKERIKYSGNSLVDVIINRYAAYCKENGLLFEVEALCSKLDFMSKSDVSSLLDNLLTNAVEAAIKSENKKVLLSIYRQENSFVMTDHIFVKVINSCDRKPKIKNGLLLSSKINPHNHGFGTKSIKKVVEKYNGSYEWSYDKKERKFTAIAILQMK